MRVIVGIAVVPAVTVSVLEAPPKRLEAGSFQLPPLDGDKPQIVIDGSAFASLLAGIDFTAARRGWYRRPRLEKSQKTIDTDPQV